MMLLCRCGGLKLRDIADAFDIACYRSVPSAISRFGEKARQKVALARATDSPQKQSHKTRNA